MKRISFLLVALFATLTMWADPAKSGIIQVVQPDGSPLRIKLYGDENFHYTTTADDYLIVENEEGYFEYAQMKANVPTTVGMRVHNVGSRDASELQTIERIGRFELDEVQLGTICQMRAQAQEPVTKAPAEALAPRCLVILVSFADNKFTTSRTEFDNMLNQRGYSNFGATGSALDYFEASSFGQYSPHFDVFGPYKLPKNMSYYGSEVPSTGAKDSHADQMIVDALNCLNADASANVNFADYDADGDGKLDIVYVFYAGYAQSQGAPSNTIWPHRSKVVASTVNNLSKYGGKSVSDYACSSELRNTTGNTVAAIGTICHEFSHVLGLADLYVTDYNSAHKTPAHWDIMAMGNQNNNYCTPPTYSAFERFYCGWLTPEMLNAADMYDLEELQCSNSCYVVTSTGNFNNRAKQPSQKKYYILENRQKVGWDTYLPGNGMLVWQINWNAQTWKDNTPNNIKETQVVSLYTPAKAALQATNKDTYPGSTKTTSFSLFDVYPVTDITEFLPDESECGVNRIHFAFMGGVPVPYTVKFNTRKMGTCDIKSLLEEESRGGVTLPEVVANEGYEFVGWSVSGVAEEADAGVANEIYHPKRDITLYAVYRDEEGEIVKGYEVSCARETFSRATGAEGVDIASSFGDYTDLIGWSGNKVSCANGAIKTTNFVITPAIEIEQTATAELTVWGDTEQSDLMIEVFGKSAATKQTFTIGTEPTTLEVDFQELGSNMKFKIYTKSAIYIDDIEICGKEYIPPVAVQNGEMGDIKLISVNPTTAMLTGVNVGDRVELYDATGRLVNAFAAKNSEFTFVRPQGFYIVRISNGGSSIAIKGL